jgi:hypothetical protein
MRCSPASDAIEHVDDALDGCRRRERGHLVGDRVDPDQRVRPPGRPVIRARLAQECTLVLPAALAKAQREQRAVETLLGTGRAFERVLGNPDLIAGDFLAPGLAGSARAVELVCPGSGGERLDHVDVPALLGVGLLEQRVLIEDPLVPVEPALRAVDRLRIPAEALGADALHDRALGHRLDRVHVPALTVRLERGHHHAPAHQGVDRREQERLA